MKITAYNHIATTLAKGAFVYTTAAGVLGRALIANAGEQHGYFSMNMRS